MSNIVLTRTYSPTETLGVWKFPDGTVFYTVELPDKHNEPQVSCIPEGTYTLKQRVSGIVSRTTKGKYTSGWEVTNVPNRTYIMVHIANTVNDLNGCIGVGSAHGRVGGLMGVVNSRAAFDQLMKKMATQQTWTLEIRKQ